MHINGEAYRVRAAASRTLLEVLREDLELTGTKCGCDEGECGACTVLLDGEPVNSCLVLAAHAQGRQVTTVEGLARGGQCHPVQEAFRSEGAVQCGFCTPGMLMSAAALLARNPAPTEEQIRSGLSGNICRCTGYVRIVRAVRRAAEMLRDSENIKTGGKD